MVIHDFVMLQIRNTKRFTWALQTTASVNDTISCHQLLICFLFQAFGLLICSCLSSSANVFQRPWVFFSFQLLLIQSALQLLMCKFRRKIMDQQSSSSARFNSAVTESFSLFITVFFIVGIQLYCLKTAIGGFLLFGKLLTCFYSEFFGTFLNRKVL